MKDMVRNILRKLGNLYRSLYFPPVLIALAILFGTGVTWRASLHSLHHDIQTAVDARIGRAEQTIRATTTSYEEILLGGVGLFRGSNEVTATDWNNYLQAFDVAKNYQSAQAFGYAHVVSNDTLESFTAYMRGQGLPDFAVHPAEPPRNQHAPVTYVQAVASKAPPNFGFDLYTDPDRSATMLRARDTGETAITKRVTIAPLGDPHTYNGFVMYVPYYRLGLPSETIAERQAAITGYVFASFRGDLFFQSIASAADSDTSGFSITVNDDKTPLYQSDHYGAVNTRREVVRVTRALQLYGEVWNVAYVFDRAGVVSDVQLRRPASVLFGGIFTSLLVALVVFLLLRSRNQELTAQKEQAVELAKDELLSLASHQLRTPATGVKQYLGMVLQGFAGKVAKDQKDLLEKAYASNDRQLSIINEILHLAKIDSGRIVLARQETNINALVEDIIAEQRPDIRAASHRITLRLPKKPLTLNVDAHTLRMAIENLLSNAIKYTPQGGEIGVRLRRDEHAIYLTIKDNGVGIAAGDVDKLFKQFSRLPNEMSLRVGGTGIGLYLARHLVELHGGHITVQTSPGKGSAFTIMLPLHTDTPL